MLMFEHLRLRITAWFVLITALALATLVFLASSIFYGGLTKSLDNELEQLASEILPVIDEVKGLPRLDGKWQNKLHGTSTLNASIQLFDEHGKILGEYGRKGVPELLLHSREIESPNGNLRCIVNPLYEQKLIGYLQVQLPTQQREEAYKQFSLAMLVLSPLLLMTVGLLAYLVERAATDPVERAFAVMQKFLSDAGHELKTPISIMQATVENLSRKSKSDDDTDRRLEVIDRTLNRMSALVHDLMLLSQIEAKQLPDKRVEFSFDNLLEEALEEVEPLFQAKSIKLTVLNMHPVTMYGDPESLHRLVLNLLSNALNYTPSGGEVGVALTGDAKTARLAVKDNGIGIPPEAVSKVFDRFFRVDASRSRDLGGAGLGLSIVKAIVDAHRGSVTVASEFGQGTQFVVLLPIARSVSPQAPNKETIL
jgi:signal transduction histidine kinase